MPPRDAHSALQPVIDAVAPSASGNEPIPADRTDPTVLVLGATGFLGRALVERLLRDGVRLRALARDRSSSRAASLARQGVEVVEGDLADTGAVQVALDGVRHVYHLARGSGPAWGDYLVHDVEPTRRLAELCCERGIGLSYTSSIAIYDGGRAGEVITEATAPSPASMRLNAYARAKVANEQLLAALHRDRGLDVVVFRPGIVIGRGGDPRHPGVGAWPDVSTCRPWGGGGHPLPFVLVDDCADALTRALQVPGIGGESFNLIGAAALSGNAYLDALERVVATPIRRAPVPAWQLFAQGLARWSAGRLGAGPARPLPSYRYCDGLSCRATYAADRARQRLGWQAVSDPAVLIERGIAAAVAETAP